MNSIIRKIYAYKAFDEFMPILPLYSVFFAEHGLNVAQISSLIIIWTVSYIVCEVPSGALADKYQRRRLLYIAQIIRAAGFVLWLCWPSYAGYAIGFVLWGLSSSLISGTYQALLYDLLESEGQAKRYTKLIGRIRSLALAASLGAALVASLVVTTGEWLVLTITIATGLAAALVAWSLPSPPPRRDAADTSYFQTILTGAKEVIHNTALLRLVLFMVFAGAVYGIAEEYFPLYLREISISTPIIPLLSAGLTAPIIAGSLLAHRLEAASTLALLWLLVVAGILLAGVGYFAGMPGIFLLAAFFFILKLLRVLFEGKLQHSIKNAHTRATITSVGEFSTELAMLGMIGVYGVVASVASNEAAFKVFGLAVIAIGAAYLLLVRGKLFRVRSKK